MIIERGLVMSQIDKLIKSVKNNPKDVRFEDLRKILLYYKFVERQPRGGSSHYYYSKDNIAISVPKKHPVNQIYVKQVIELLEL
jgi:hypothetical protein